jgi:hypothetical protein
VDNTRLLVAKLLNIDNVPTNIHNMDDFLPDAMINIKRFGEDARTWGEAILYRTGRQTPRIPKWGTPNMPSLD